MLPALITLAVVRILLGVGPIIITVVQGRTHPSGSRRAASVAKAH